MEFITYADDITVMIKAFNSSKLVSRASEAFKLIRDKALTMGLQINYQKTKAIAFAQSFKTRSKIKSCFLKLINDAGNFNLNTKDFFPRNVKILGHFFNFRLSNRTDCSKFKNALKRALSAVKLALRVGMKHHLCWILWRSLSIASLVFFARGRPPESQDQFVELFYKAIESLPLTGKRRQCIKCDEKMRNWLSR